MHDLLISGGHLIDPSQDIDGPRDIAISGGSVAEVAERIDPAHAARRLDATGCYVTPGLIDLHAHAYWGVSHYGIDLDTFSLGRGVTTMLDPGSAGAQTWLGLRSHVIEKAAARIYAYLNISLLGMIAQKVGECEDLRYLDTPFAVRTVEANRDLLLGMKVRLSQDIVGSNDLEPLRRALEAATLLGVPAMVHVGETPASLAEILPMMRPGDTMTHCYHGRSYGVLDEKGRVLPQVWEAMERGVVMDVGHGRGSFVFTTAERALDQGLLPTTISSDIHTHSVPRPAVDLVTTMSKFLMLGMSLHEVVRRTTVAPAKVLGESDRLGTLRPGAEADVTVLKLEEGEFTYRDCVGEKRGWNRRLEPVAVVKGGREHPITPRPSAPRPDSLP